MRVVWVVLAGCSYAPSIAPADGPNDDAATPDAAVTIDAPPELCFGSPGWVVCVPEPQQPLELAGTIDTRLDARCTMPTPASWLATQDDACVIAATTITIPTTSRITGTRPVVLLASEAIVITGTLDTASRRSGSARLGPGANANACSTSTSGTTMGARGGGGGGGSLGSKGGDGGTGGIGARGVAGAAELPPHERLHGGCPGGGGAAGNDSTAPGGAGGGAAFLIAGASIEITGAVNASGAAGTGGDAMRGGGGGGGSGGMIVLHAPTLTVAGRLLANGGAGGGGATGSDGQHGAEPDPAEPLVAAGGGNGRGGRGGAGAVDGTPAGTGDASGDGGGGGGGGVGVIRVLAGEVPVGPNISPAARGS
jgi:hypothetical protein